MGANAVFRCFLGAFSLLTSLVAVPATAQLTVWLSPHDFGSIEVGQSSPVHWIRVENTSGSTLAITFVQSASSPFALVGTTCPTFPVTLQFLDECEFGFQFSPTSVGTFNQILDVGWQGGAGSSGTVQIDIAGEGVVPTLVVVPVSGTLDFGNVDVGQTSSALTFTLENGSTPDVDVSSIQHPAAPFTHVGGTCPVPPFTLTAIQACTLEYQFSPTVAGFQSDNLVVSANIPAGSVNLSVVGNGVSTAAPELSITPVLTDFGQVQVGLIAGPLNVLYENIGNADLTVSLMDSVNAPFFILSNGCGGPPFTLTPGNSCQISYTFAPATDGPATQVISIASNDPSPGGHAITLTGVAEHSLIDITPPLIDFLDVTVGQTVVLPMDVVNPGMTFDISIFGPTGLGPLPPEFDIQPGTCGSFPFILSPGNACQLLVSFTPSAVGPASHMNLLNHDASGGSGDYTFMGNGVGDQVFADRFQFP